MVNLLGATRACGTVKRMIITSSTLVCEIGYVPESDTDYCPTTPYGASKVEVERVTRAAEGLGCSWTIVRPVSIWGPWFGEPYRNLFKAIKAGWYCHVGAASEKKSLGYVENTVHQMYNLLTAPADQVHARTMYLADHPPTSLHDFAEAIRRELSAPPIWRMPRILARAAARGGDLLRILGWEGVPLTTFRLNNILTEYVYDVSPIMRIAEPLPYSLDEGVARTSEWLQRNAW